MLLGHDAVDHFVYRNAILAWKCRTIAKKSRVTIILCVREEIQGARPGKTTACCLLNMNWKPLTAHHGNPRD